MAASATGSSVVAADLILWETLSAAVVEMSTVSANLTGQQSLAASVTGSSAAAADLTLGEYLIASVVNYTTADADLTLRYLDDLTGAVTGTSTTTANLTGRQSLFAAATATTIAICDLILIVPATAGSTSWHGDAFVTSGSIGDVIIAEASQGDAETVGTQGEVVGGCDGLRFG
jgi:hypothetical protein